MKHLYTSYFARNAHKTNAIAICGLLTSWVRSDIGFQGEHRPELGPPWELVKQAKNGNVSEEQFEYEYLQSLQKRGWGPQNIVDSLPNEAILLCYETPQDFCHRHILARWLEQYASVFVHELRNDYEQRELEQQQLVDKLVEW